MSNVVPFGAEPMHGVSLEQFVGVSVALEEGLPLHVILASEGIAADAWPKADSAWKVRAAKDERAFTALREKRLVAEDCLARSTAPIDSDLAAWMSFLHAYGAHAAPFEMLHGAGLRLNDLSRLQRRWAARMAEDPGLEKQAADLARRGLPGPSPLRVAPSVLKPFPWTRARVSTTGPAASTPKPPVVVPSDTRMAPGQLRFYSYVAIKARLAEHPGDEERVLREVGMKDFATTDAEWQAIMAENPELARDYRRLYEGHRAKLRSRPNAPPAQTGPTPIAEGPPPARASEPIVTQTVAPVRAPGKLAGTSMAFDAPRGPALPFASGASASGSTREPPRAPAPRPSLAGTSMAVREPSKAALPFAPGRPAAPPSPPRPSLTGTSLAVDAPPPKAPIPARRGPNTLAGTSLVLDPPRGPALPFSGDAPKPSVAVEEPPTSMRLDAAPSLTLEQHASLVCEIGLAPERALETLSRYRITPAQKVAADKHYAERIAREPGLRERWDEAKRRFGEYLAGQKVSR
jgi:hypothetical protein